MGLKSTNLLTVVNLPARVTGVVVWTSSVVVKNNVVDLVVLIVVVEVVEVEFIVEELDDKIFVVNSSLICCFCFSLRICNLC